MIGTVISNLLRFLVLMLLQVLLLDQLDVANGYVVPYLYVLFLLMLPLELPGWAGLIIGAITGFTMDLFSSTPGMHMSACVVMMYLRIHLLRIITPREGYEHTMRASIPSMGFTWFITYAGLLILAHHLWLFFVELYSFDRFLGTLLRGILSAAFTIVLVILAQFLSRAPDRGRT
ncbi:MAG: rod shape-determining protein MreD [Flavobacteriales bacterium]|nr:rod shape-determining protein MreD [Flavobacteriales bacterium]